MKKLNALVLVPDGLMTVMGPVTAPAGTTHPSRLELAIVKVASTPLNRTPVTSQNRYRRLSRCLRLARLAVERLSPGGRQCAHVPNKIWMRFPSYSVMAASGIRLR
jgi:hypothetical protein